MSQIAGSSSSESWFVVEIVLLIALCVGAYYLIRHIRMKRYFASPEFLARKEQLQAVVRDHNELAAYINEIRSRGTFSFGSSATGQYAHLATGANTSQWNYQRDRNTVTNAPNVHQASLQVVTKAQQEPIKYLMKYFGFTADESTLQRVEAMGESISQLEEAVGNLKQREAALTQAVEPPAFIKKHYMKEFMAHMGASFSEITVPYPKYVFEYVSAGGNSGQKSEITLNSPTIDAIVETMNQKIKWRKSVAGQRALMTTRLRNEIKARDNYTCRSCGISTYVEPHLLIEVDHIIPVSRGGLTERENLQALCWKCNRSKSNKIMA